MIKKTVRLAIAILMLGATALWSPAQEDTEAPKKPRTKAEQAAREARNKAIEKRQKAKAKADAEAKAKALDLNRASREELKKLPGITDAMADGIIAKRPHHSKLDLVTKGIVPAGTYEGLKKLVAAK